MKREIRFALEGRDWWKPFTVYWIVFIILYVPQFLIRSGSQTAPDRVVLNLIVSFVIAFLMMIVGSIYAIVFFRIMLPKIIVADKQLAFGGAIGRYVWLNVSGLLLSIITIGVYFPWYFRRITAYLVSQSTIDGVAPQFLGKGGKLFVNLLLCFVVPFVVLMGLLVLALTLTPAGGAPGSTQLLTSLVTLVVIFLIMVPMVYTIYKWYVNIQWRGYLLLWRTKFWRSVGFILGQTVLTIITLSVYWPVAFIRIYRYFCARTLVTEGEREAWRLAFEGPVGKGFGLLWGQTLLMTITIGFYSPWGVTKIARWMLNRTVLESPPAA